MNLDLNDDDSEESDFLSIAGEDVDVHLNHYRVPRLLDNGPYGINNPPKNRGCKDQVKFSNEGKIMTLTELAAQKVACHLPFGLVEHFDPPVPESMQCRIAFWSFPQDEEDVKLYTCLANGNADFFYRAEELINQNAVRDMLQVGFHLSSNVHFISDSEHLEVFRVALTFDRRRITSCSCTCMTSTFWCQHVVAVCLQRIRKPQEVKLRAPVSESLQRLEKNQLQKFAQYLINELPQQILPAAQKLLDELLSGDEAIINQNPAAPDPTAGATINEETSWCLDYTHLSIDIHRILLKQCTAQPTVCSDIQSLHVTAPPAATEYSQLLRPIRGREPEGIWNLISIVGEMMKRRDANLFLLLEIITDEVMKFDKIVTWWFETKVSLHSGSSIHFASTKHSQSTSQYSCSNFCDEIVHLWRLAALNPSASPAQRQSLLKKFFDWHLIIITKHSSISDSGFIAPNVTASKRNLLELFPGFKSAMEGCHIDWSDWDEKRATLITSYESGGVESEKPTKPTKRRRRKSRASKQTATDPQPSTSTNGIATDEQENVCKSENELNGQSNTELISTVESNSCGHVSEPQFNDSPPQEKPERQSNRSQYPEPLREIIDNQVPALAGAAQGANELEDELQVYFMDRQQEGLQTHQEPETLESLIKVNAKRLADPLEIMYAKVEGLHAHGHIEEARVVARRLALEILSQRNYPTMRQLYTLSRRRKKKGSLDNQMSIVFSETLTKVNFLCTVLIGDLDSHGLLFKLVMFGVALKRAPAATRPLEVKLISQKQELVMLLKNIVLHDEELDILREKAEAIRDRDNEDQPDPLTTLIMGSYIFDALVLTRHSRSVTDASLGFQSALSALGVKINISESDHPLLSEGIRRQRGELALSMIIHFKDDQEKLDAILKRLLDKDLVESPAITCDKSPTNCRKGVNLQDPNQPSEAAAHFMFELAKTVFDKAGGNSTTAHLFRPQLVAQNGGRSIHRKLHMCTLRIALYALGLQNRTSPNWIHRTYNGRASFIHEQALDIGLPAIKFLCDNWQGYLTPVEAASIADKAGCSNDPDIKKIAAEMARSCLRYANFLDFNAVSRILAQCKEQTIEMVEEACSEIGQMAENETVCADVLFATARAWYGLYLNLITDERHCANGNSYQLENLTASEQQETGAGYWLAEGQSHLDGKHQQLNGVPDPPLGEGFFQRNFILTDVTPIAKNSNYVRAAFHVGIKALDSLKLSPHVGVKHNPKKLDETLWLLGISISLGGEGLREFSCSIVKNITDPYILHIIIIEIFKFFSIIRLPKDNAEGEKVLKPIYLSCIASCKQQAKELMKNSSYDQKTCVETILDVVQTLTIVYRDETTVKHYEEILTNLELKRNNRRCRITINIVERRAWLKNFKYKLDQLQPPSHIPPQPQAHLPPQPHLQPQPLLPPPPPQTSLLPQPQSHLTPQTQTPLHSQPQSPLHPQPHLPPQQLQSRQLIFCVDSCCCRRRELDPARKPRSKPQYRSN